MLDDYLTVKQVANRLQLNYKTVIKMCQLGKLEATKPLGNRAGWRISTIALESYLKDHRN